MMQAQALWPTYTIRVEVRDKPPAPTIIPNFGAAQGNYGQQSALDTKLYQFHDATNGKTGCDEVLAAVKERLKDLPGLSVTLERFEHR